MLSVNPHAVNILDEKNADFAGLRGVCDRVSRELWQEGIGATVKHAEGISFEEQQMLWNEGVIGCDSPSSLLNAVFYYNGKVLILRGGREHCLLKRSQFSFGSDQGPSSKLDYVEYVENGSKGLSTLALSNWIKLDPLDNFL